MANKIQSITVPFLDSELDQWVAGLPRLLAYPDRLADARKQKASKKNWSIKKEQDLVCEAREVKKIIHGLSASGLRSLNQLNAAGQLEHSYGVFIDRFKDRKKLQVAELCTELLNVCKSQKKAPFNESNTRKLIESVLELDDFISFEKNQMFLAGKSAKVEITSSPQFDGVLSNGAKIRFQPDMLRVATENLVATGRMGAGRVRDPGVKQLNLSNAATAGLSELMSIATGHNRRLEEIGLQTHEGSDTVSLIAAVVMVIGIAGISAGSGMVADGNQDGWWLIGGGIILLAGGAAAGGAELLMETAKSAIAEAIGPFIA